MKILVCVKQVAARDSALVLRPDTASAGAISLDTTDLRWEMNEPDAYALEEGLQLRDRLGGEVLVVSAGPERAAQTIREALAKGADRGIHLLLPQEPPVTADPFATAQLLAGIVREENPDLVLTGLQSDDGGYGQTGVILAELVGFPHATIVVEVEPGGATIRVKRELESGWYQNMTLPLPALITVQSGIRKLRYATLMGIKKAKTKEVRTLPAALPASSFSVTAIKAPESAKTTVMLTGDVAHIAHELVEKLRFEARVL